MQNPLSFLDVKIELVKISIGIVQQELDGRSLFTVRLAMKLLFRTTPEISLTQYRRELLQSGRRRTDTSTTGATRFFFSVSV